MNREVGEHRGCAGRALLSQAFQCPSRPKKTNQQGLVGSSRAEAAKGRELGLVVRKGGGSVKPSQSLFRDSPPGHTGGQGEILGAGLALLRQRELRRTIR